VTHTHRIIINVCRSDICLVSSQIVRHIFNTKHMGGNRFQYIHYTAEREATLFGKKKTALGEIDEYEL
jgi:hypothetical protein